MDFDLKNSILKSGTTILGIVCKDGIVLGADTQSTAGTIVMDKDSEKIQRINEYMVFAGTGMVSDIQRSVKIAAAEMRLKELRSRARPNVEQAAHLVSTLIYNSIRQPQMLQFMVGSLIAGVNEDGRSQLFSIDPAGGIKEIKDYDANFGSGMPYVLGLLERQYKREITVREGVELAKEALKSSTQRDVGSGFGIHIFTITKDGVKQIVKQEIQSEYKDKK